MTPSPTKTNPVWENATAQQQEKVQQLLTKLIHQYLKAAHAAAMEGQHEPATQNQ